MAETATMRPDKPDTLVSVTAVCNQLNVSRPTVLRLIANGSLRAGKIGRQLRISKKSLDAFLERQLS